MSSFDSNENKIISGTDFSSFCQQFAFKPKEVRKRKHSELKKSEDDPFVAPHPNKYRDKFSTPCISCFNNSEVCRHNKENRLKLLIIGHNPSEHAWKSGNMYSNPTNRMWKILTGTFCPEKSHGIIPDILTIDDQNSLPKDYGIGFCDLGTVPGNQADSFSKEELEKWRRDLFDRLTRHLQRVCRETHKDPTCTLHCHSPHLILFSGKSQFVAIAGKSKVEMGLQTQLPMDWPFAKDSKVYVCPSSSGRCVMKKEVIASYYEEAFSLYRSLSLV